MSKKQPKIADIAGVPDLEEMLLKQETSEIKKMFAEDFLDTFIKEYGLYVVETRALPNIMDGLRVGARKILYAAMKSSKLKAGHSIKYPALMGDTMSLMYAHGDSSLKNTIEQLSSTHLFKYCPLETEGQIGSLRTPQVTTAARYLSVTYSPYMFMYANDSELWRIKDEEGVMVEPEYFYPIIPMQLLQRTSSPGFGFSYHTFSYNIGNVIDCVLQAVLYGTCRREKHPIILHPEVEGINPNNIVYNTTSGDWYNIGEYEIKDDDLIITDLPYNIGYTKFEDILKNYEERGYIKGFTDKTQGGKMCYYIHFEKGRLAVEYSKKWKFYQRFCLFSKIKKNTLNVIDADDKRILNFKDEYALIDAFVKRRLAVYQRRKIKLAKDTANNIEELLDKAKFIDAVINKKLVINNRPIGDIKKDLKKLGITEAGLSLRISQLTLEEYNKLKKKIKEAQKYFEYVSSTSEQEMYVNDLVELKEKLGQLTIIE